MQAKKLGLWAAALVALVTLGCNQDEEVRRYTAPKPEVLGPKVRLVAAIFPQADHSWFFKFQGPADEITAQHEAFLSFIRSVRFTGQEDKPITWSLPEGWQEEKGRPARYTTLLFGPKDHRLEISVSTAGGSLMMNVNRWCGQLGLRPLADDDLDLVTKKLDVNGVGVTLVDLTGTASSKPPMMKGR